MYFLRIIIIVSNNFIILIVIIHSKIYPSLVNGPGKRFVLWTQGCKKACKGCFNPDTWSKNGKEIDIQDLFLEVKKLDCDGVTITGGDPLEQADEMLEFLKKLNVLDLKKGVILYTGFTIEEIKYLGGDILDCLNYVDLLIDGRYVEKLYENNGMKGSKNQRYHFLTNKLNEKDLSIEHEIEIGFNDELYLTGFPHLNGKILKKFGIIMK